LVEPFNIPPPNPIKKIQHRSMLSPSKKDKPSSPANVINMLVISNIRYPNLSTTGPKTSDPDKTPIGRNVTSDEAFTASKAYLAVNAGKTVPITMNAIPKKAIPVHAAIYTDSLLYIIF
jgi:hypothetical protein